MWSDIEVRVKKSNSLSTRSNQRFGRVMVVACVAGAVLVGCEKPAETTGVPETPRARVSPPEKKFEPKAKTAATPVIDALAAVYGKVGKDKPMELLYLKPLAVGLEFDKNAEPNARETLSAWLLTRQGVLDEFAALANQKLEEVPQIDTGGWDGHLKHPKGQIQNLSQVMMADAARLADAKDYAGAVGRCVAVMKWGRQLVNQEDPALRSMGGFLATMASQRFVRIGEAADVSGVDGKDAAAVVNSFDFADPTRRMADLAAESKATIEYLRQQFKGPEAGAKYGQYLEEVGALPVTSLPGMTDAEFAALKPLLAMLPDRTFGEQARKMSEGEIGKALDAAAKLVDPLVAAIQKGDQAVLKPLLDQVASDKTQVSRIALGGLGVVLPTRAMLQDSLTKAKATTEKMKK